MTAAAECEAFGQPERPAWLDSRIGKQIACFGEHGIVLDVLQEVVVCQRWPGHEIVIITRGNPYLGHNQDHSSDYLPLCAVDPMCGIDFMRYATREDVRDLIPRWAHWCDVVRHRGGPERG
ncbi:MAG TPA: hypothetical protein VFB99_08530 [Vicinamibacterales bacterium]|nr:hypothetical protein [Vicinamibacterales bacterium]